MNKKTILLALAFYKFLIMNIGLFILAKHTSLGDNLAYIQQDFITAVTRDHHVISATTAATQVLVLLVKKLLFDSAYFTNLFFNLLSFIGIAVAISKITFKKDLVSYLFLLVLFLPNFSLWSSIAGKEALIVFFSGFLIRAMVDYFEYASSLSSGPIDRKNIARRAIAQIGLLLCTFIVLWYKPAFAIFIVPLLIFISFRRINVNYRLIFYILILLVFVAICYWMREAIEHFTRNIYEAFPDTAHSNRETIWTYRFAYFYTLPYTMWVSLWGPLWGELNNATKLLTFIESSVLFLCYFGFFILFIINSCQNNVKLASSLVLILSIILCVITLTAMGYINPGSAIRYRTNNYMFLLVFFYYLSRINSGYARQAEVVNHRQLSA